MRIALCDDDAHYRAKLLELMKEYVSQHMNRDITFYIYESAEELLSAVEKSESFDIYILDIIMNEMNGIDLGLKLRQMGHNDKIIYLTSSVEFAFDAFKARAYHYILKPIKKEEFFSVLTETVDTIVSQKDRSIIVKTKESSVKLNIDRILYAELCRRVIIYHLINGKSIETLTIRTSFSDAVQELLQDRRFVLCGAGMTVNLQHITTVENEMLIFKDTHKVYLSKKHCRDIRSAWYDFWFDEEV